MKMSMKLHESVLKRTRQEGEKQQAETFLQQIEELKLQKKKATKTEKGTGEFTKATVGAGGSVVLLFSTMCLFACETYVLWF